MPVQPRVAYFPDSFHEVNGVAHTSRNFVAYAQRHRLPFLCVRAGHRATPIEQDGPLTTLELPRSAAAFAVEKDLDFDPLFFRHLDLIEDTLHRFRPDILHITGPSELGIFAAYFAHQLNLPLAAGWHTNVHEYAPRRLDWLLNRLPGALGPATGAGIESTIFDVTRRFYSLAKVLFAPNPDLCAQLTSATGVPTHLMQRGVDCDLFTPALRSPAQPARPFILGYVGRLSPEKNVALLPVLERALTAAGLPVRLRIIGHGTELESLHQALPTAEFPGVLRGTDLARAYAGMDLFVFPSHTDTFGNVVLEALASGVPALVTPSGGPATIVTPATGIIATDADFPAQAAALLSDPDRLTAMRHAARAAALTRTWDAVFDRVYAAYQTIL